MNILGQMTVNLITVDFNLASNIYFLTLSLIYNLTLDISFK